MPYIYSGFLAASETGEPVQKPLVFEFQDDPATRDIDDEYLFGDHLLVAPVFEEGCTARQVYLPEGTWHHWHTGEKFAGREYVIAPAPMDHIPLYARGGAVIPTWPRAPRSTMGYHPGEIELHVFIPDEDGQTRSMLHEDDGLTFASREGAFYRTDFVLGKNGPRLTVSASVSGRGYPEFARKRFLLRFHGADVTGITVDGSPAEAVDGVIVIENTGGDFSLEAEIA